MQGNYAGHKVKLLEGRLTMEDGSVMFFSQAEEIFDG
jgi:hypothetical protein